MLRTKHKNQAGHFITDILAGITIIGIVFVSAYVFAIGLEHHAEIQAEHNTELAARHD